MVERVTAVQGFKKYLKKVVCFWLRLLQMNCIIIFVGDIVINLFYTLIFFQGHEGFIKRIYLSQLLLMIFTIY